MATLHEINDALRSAEVALLTDHGWTPPNERRRPGDPRGLVAAVLAAAPEYVANAALLELAARIGRHTTSSYHARSFVDAWDAAEGRALPQVLELLRSIYGESHGPSQCD